MTRNSQLEQAINSVMSCLAVSMIVKNLQELPVLSSGEDQKNSCKTKLTVPHILNLKFFWLMDQKFLKSFMRVKYYSKKFCCLEYCLMFSST